MPIFSLIKYDVETKIICIVKNKIRNRYLLHLIRNIQYFHLYSNNESK